MIEKFSTHLAIVLFLAMSPSSLLQGAEPDATAPNQDSDIATGFAVYVAADAAPGGDGSQQKPFQTLAAARDGIRDARKSGSLSADRAVTVQIGPGVYRQTSSLFLTSQDGGSAEAPVIYRADTPGTARIRGSVALSPKSFKAITDDNVKSRLDPSVRDKVLVCDLSKALPKKFGGFKQSFRGVPAGPWLYVNHHPMTLARWPNVDAANDGWAEFSKAVDTGLAKPNADDPALRKAHPGSFEFADPRPAKWNLDDGVWLLGYWTHDWYDEVIQVKSYDAATKVISLAAKHNYGIMGGTWGAAKRRFFAFNLLEELDAPGEWYLDRTSSRLYYYPDASWNEASVELATLREPLLKIDSAKHIQFEGLAFEYGHSHGIVLTKSHNAEINGCVIANLAKSGVAVNGSENTIRSCDLYNLGTNGISLAGGDRKTLTPANNTAINNHIHHYGLFQRAYAPGVGAHGCGQIVLNNTIHDAPHNAISYGGNEHRFEQNEIYRVVMETGDSGAFYTGRDWTSQGNVLRHNYIHHLGGGDSDHVNTMGVYIDDCDSGDTVDGNIFYRAGRAFLIGGGRDNQVTNNLVLDCPIGLHLDSRGMRWKQWNSPTDVSWQLERKAKELAYTTPPWSVRYPKLAVIMNDSPREPLNNAIRRNVFVDCANQVCNFDDNVKKLLHKLDISDNVVINTTGATGIATMKDVPGFTNISGSVSDPIQIGFDPAVRDRPFQLRDARLREAAGGFEEIPFDKIGLYTDTYRHRVPPVEL